MADRLVICWAGGSNKASFDHLGLQKKKQIARRIQGWSTSTKYEDPQEWDKGQAWDQSQCNKAMAGEGMLHYVVGGWIN